MAMRGLQQLDHGTQRPAPARQLRIQQRMARRLNALLQRLLPAIATPHALQLRQHTRRARHEGGLRSLGGVGGGHGENLKYCMNIQHS